MRASSLCVVVLAALALVAQVLPAAAGACGYGGMDFSSLAGKDWPGTDGTEQYKYFVSVCGVLSSTDAASCTEVQSTSAACQIQISGGPQTFDIGDYNTNAPPAWQYIDGNADAGAMYGLSGSPDCWDESGSQVPYTASIMLRCADKLDEKFTVAAFPASCHKNFTLGTPLACENSGNGGHGAQKLSGGWVFIIILCVVIPVYVAGGCLYKSQKLGATGMDKCPNVEVSTADE
jgi:hypothetical protein